MTPAAETFLDAIRAAPDDDAPRLIYADWLDERGDADSRALADFIRLQLATEAAPYGSLARDESRRREYSVPETRINAWSRPFAQLGVNVAFQRGLPAVARFEGPESVAGAIDERLARLARVGPGLCGAWFHKLETGLLGEWLQRPPPFRVVELTLAGDEDDFTPGAVAALANSPWLGDVERLSIKLLGGWGERTSQRLLDLLGPVLRAISRRTDATLRSLDLSRCWDRWDPAVGERLADLSIFDQVETLDLSSNRFGDGLSDFLGACRLPRVRTLLLRSTYDRTNGSLRIPPTALRSLKNLNLSGCGEVDLPATLATGREQGGSLECLYFAFGWFGVGSLLAWPRDLRIDSLVRVRLDNSGLNDDHARWLAESDFASPFDELRLQRNWLTDVGARALAEGGSLARLRTLDLRDNRVSPAGAQAIRESPRLPNLESLWC